MAVNAFDVVQGWFKLDVNEHRSYTITCEIRLLTDPSQSRLNQWNLHQQTYWFDSNPPQSEYPEHHGMYEPLE